MAILTDAEEGEFQLRHPSGPAGTRRRISLAYALAACSAEPPVGTAWAIAPVLCSRVSATNR